METIKVCRDIVMEIKDGQGQKVVPVEVRDVCQASDFVTLLCVEKRIEALGSEKLHGLFRVRSSSSLLFQAAHQAFARHYPLALRPEVLMSIIAHEIAVTVKQHPDEYRYLFTKTQSGKTTIEVRHDGLVRGDPSSPWHEVFPRFNAALREVVPGDIMEHVLPGFTTATSESDAASMVMFMDAASPFYDYREWSLCGIPRIRLLGTPEDYRKLLRAASALAECFDKHLGLYFRHLLPVLKTLADQADGATEDQEFWKSVYKNHSQSGSNVFNGWLSAFVNYVQRADSEPLTPKDDELYDWTACGEGWKMTGLNVGCVPSHVAEVPFIWNYLDDELPMTFIGGVLGVDTLDGFLAPRLSYGILEG